MVIQSDITRWGFKLDLPISEEDEMYAEVTSSYSGGDWLILISVEANMGAKELHIFYCDGSKRLSQYVSSPNDIYNALKKVGYFWHI